MIQFEKEVIDYLGLPSIPKRIWDGTSTFKTGVAIVCLYGDKEAYAVASFDVDKHYSKPSITKVFGVEPFKSIKQIYVVPSYMETDLTDADLDEESKRRAEILLEEAKEIENDGTEMETKQNLANPYYFDNIHSDEEARAFIAAYNSRNRIRGKIPKNHETLVMRLAVIFSETNKTNKKK